MYENMTIRLVEDADTEELLAIYAPYVTDTAITFEYEIPSALEFGERIRGISERYPYLVAVCERELLGYAYASSFKDRDAYDWAVEISVYIKLGIHRGGIGKKLYESLEAILRKQHIINLNACIAYPNPESVTFHEKMGYCQVAHFTKCGFKSGRWHDMIWMEKMLSEHTDNPERVLTIKEIKV